MSEQKNIRMSEKAARRIDILHKTTLRTTGGVVEYAVDLMWRMENASRQAANLTSLNEIEEKMLAEGQQEVVEA